MSDTPASPHLRADRIRSSSQFRARFHTIVTSTRSAISAQASASSPTTKHLNVSVSNYNRANCAVASGLSALLTLASRFGCTPQLKIITFLHPEAVHTEDHADTTDTPATNTGIDSNA